MENESHLTEGGKQVQIFIQVFVPSLASTASSHNAMRYGQTVYLDEFLMNESRSHFEVIFG